MVAAFFVSAAEPPISNRIQFLLDMRTKASHAPLYRLISKLGLASGKQAIELATAGRIRVNGVRVLNPDSWQPLNGRVEMDGVACEPTSHRVVMMHKKRGVLTARVDPHRPVVCDHPMLKDKGLNPVGRLDMASEGLLLFTSDNQLGNQLTCPEAHLPKRYFVRVVNPLTAAELAALGTSIDLDGELTLPSTWTSMAEQRNPNWVSIELLEGKNRQIRRMLQVVGAKVQRLIRVAIGPLELGSLARGAVRELSIEEEASLRRKTGVTGRGGPFTHMP